MYNLKKTCIGFAKRPISIQKVIIPNQNLTPAKAFSGKGIPVQSVVKASYTKSRLISPKGKTRPTALTKAMAKLRLGQVSAAIKATCLPVSHDIYIIPKN